MEPGVRPGPAEQPFQLVLGRRAGQRGDAGGEIQPVCLPVPRRICASLYNRNKAANGKLNKDGTAAAWKSGRSARCSLKYSATGRSTNRMLTTIIATSAATKTSTGRAGAPAPIRAA